MRLFHVSDIKRARVAVSVALRNGTLHRAERCEKCERRVPTEAHHDDYARPVDVCWLCRPCHRARHAELGWGLPSSLASHPLVGPLPRSERQMDGRWRRESWRREIVAGARSTNRRMSTRAKRAHRALLSTDREVA